MSPECLTDDGPVISSISHVQGLMECLVRQRQMMVTPEAEAVRVQHVSIVWSNAAFPLAPPAGQASNAMNISHLFP